MRRDFRKFQILDFLARVGEATAKEVYEAIPSPPKNPSTLTNHLTHYCKSGLLKKRFFRGKALYSLTEKGQERLWYFRYVKFKEISALTK